jgi:hypothetical protein
MKLINPNSKRAFVNLLSDFILQRLGKTSKTIIQITIFNNFIIAYGKTDSEVSYDLSEIKDSFFEKLGLIQGQWQIVPAIGLHILQWWLVMRVVFKHYR